MAKEKNLTNITSVAAADFVRMVTSAGASVKATAANLAKYIVETYNGSTVAGSAQSVKSALDSLNSNKQSVTMPTPLTTGANLQTLSIGEYCADNNTVAASLVNSPTVYNCKVIVYMRTTARKNIEIFDLQGEHFLCVQTGDNAWSNWYKYTKTTV